MTERFELSRRKVLAGLGTIGVASAGVGVGTSAYFSDVETYTNNRLVAGSLDMKVAYSAHYSDWSPDEGEGVEVRMWNGPAGTTGGPGDLQDGETGLPTNATWLIAVDDPDQFLANTQYASAGSADCVEGTDDDDLEQPVIDIEDVKPGDFGEVTFDFALCDNPGFVWLQGELLDAAENGLTEPEGKDDDETEGVVELLDVVQAAAWVDDGDNYQDGDEEPAIVGSLRDVLDALGSGNGLGLVGDIPAEEGGGTGRNCFSADETHSVAFAWWVPIDHGNEIQTDSVTFDLGFYTEQCRHNNGSGIGTEEASGPVTLTTDDSPPWITAEVDPGPTTTVTVELDDDVYGDWPDNSTSYVMEANIDIDTDGLAGSDADGSTDDFRIGFGGADAAARDGTAGGYIKRNEPGAGGYFTTLEEDVEGFSATESGDKLTYTMEIDWMSDDLPETPTTRSAPEPGSIIVNEVFGSDGGNGVQSTTVDPTTEPSGTLNTGL